MAQWRDQKGEGYIQTGVSAPNITDIAKAEVFQYVAYYRWSRFNVTQGDRPESIQGIRASAELLPMFGVAPLLGRVLTPEEMEAGRDHSAVIGYRLWQTRYAADPAILGKTIALDQRRYTIVGVMRASFRFTWDQEMDVFVPLVLTPEERSETSRATSRDLQTQARLKPGLTIEQGQAAMNTVAANLAREHPAADAGWGIKGRAAACRLSSPHAEAPLHHARRGDARFADCVCERFEPAPGPGDDAQARDCGPDGDWREPCTLAAAVVNRKLTAGGLGGE